MDNIYYEYEISFLDKEIKELVAENKQLKKRISELESEKALKELVKQSEELGLYENN